MFVFGDDGGDVVDHAEVVLAHHTQGDGIFASSLAGPAGRDYAVAETFAQGRGVRAVDTVDFDAAARGDKTKHFVAIDGVAATGHLEVDAFEVAVYHEHVGVATAAGVFIVVHHKLIGRAHGCTLCQALFAAGQFLIALNEGIDVGFLFGNGFEKLRRLFEARLFDELVDEAFVPVNFAIFEFALEQFAGYDAFAGLEVAHGRAYLGPGVARGYHIDPLHFGRLSVGREHLDGGAAFEFLTNGHVAAVDASAYAAVAYVGVDVVGKVKHSRLRRQTVEVAFGREHVDFFLHRLGGQIVGEFLLVAGLEGVADGSQPRVYAATAAFHTLIAPVGCQAVLGDFVHTLGADLHLHPFVFGAQHGDVQTLVAVALGHGEPVAKAVEVGGVFVGDERKHFPAIVFLFGRRRVDDDAYGKEVVDAVEAALLFLHLLPDGIDALGASLHVVAQPLGVEHLAYGRNEVFDIGVAGTLSGVEVFLDHIIGLRLEVFEREVFELALEFVESQFVRKGRIEARGLGGQCLANVKEGRVFDVAHDDHTPGNEQQHHAHIGGLGDEEVAEVLRLHSLCLGHEPLHVGQVGERGLHTGRALCQYRLGVVAAKGDGIDDKCRNEVAVQPNLFGGQQGGFKGNVHLVQSEAVVQLSAGVKQPTDDVGRLTRRVASGAKRVVAIELEQLGPVDESFGCSECVALHSCRLCVVCGEKNYALFFQSSMSRRARLTGPGMAGRLSRLYHPPLLSSLRCRVMVPPA